MDKLQVVCHVKAEDYVAFSGWYYRNNEQGRRTKRRLYLWGLALFLVFAAIEAKDPVKGAHQPGYYALYMAVSFIMMVGVCWFFIWWLLPTMARLEVTQGPRKQIVGTTTFEFGRDGIQVANEQGRGLVAWAAVEEVGETKTHVFLTLGGKNAFILPKHCLEDADQVAARLQEMKRDSLA